MENTTPPLKILNKVKYFLIFMTKRIRFTGVGQNLKFTRFNNSTRKLTHNLFLISGSQFV